MAVVKAGKKINLPMYRKDRLKNLVFLSPSLCTNGLSYLGKATQLTLCIKDAQPRSGIKEQRQNRHQLLHRKQKHADLHFFTINGDIL